MYPDLEQQEIVFVHKLSSGEPRARSRALKKLHTFLSEELDNESLNAETITNLSKGLHYAMWMQDKPLLQEELADSIASLIDDFTAPIDAAVFVECFFKALSKEWHLIDRWRMDKFLMMVRVFVRKIFHVMAADEWASRTVIPFLTALSDTLIKPTSNVVDSLKTHFASIYWNEFGLCPNITEEITNTFLEQYFDVLAQNRTSDLYFRSICDEIFESLVLTVSRKLHSEEMDDSYDEMTRILCVNNPVPLNVDLISSKLFAIGAKPTVNNRRRRRLYTLSKKFAAIVKGKDPVARPMPESKEPAVPKILINNAIDKLKSFDAKVKKDREKFKTEMKVIKKKEKEANAAAIEKIKLAAKKKASKRKPANKFKPGAIKKKTGHHKLQGVTKKKSKR